MRVHRNNEADDAWIWRCLKLWTESESQHCVDALAPMKLVDARFFAQRARRWRAEIPLAVRDIRSPFRPLRRNHSAKSDVRAIGEFCAISPWILTQALVRVVCKWFNIDWELGDG
jgi:hypothetical protein